jgi:hypothetical protein
MPSNRSGSLSRRDGHEDREFKFDITRSAALARDLGAGDDSVEIRGDVPQIRLTFTGAEVGDGSATDSNSLLNQDGGLAVRVQAEDALGNLVGPVSRFDDEGITFTTKGDATFDVRDLVTGASRGLFDVVILGTSGADRINAGDDDGHRGRGHGDDDEHHGGRHNDAAQAFYINGGAGDDRITGGSLNDFLVGGTGNDRIRGRDGDDSTLFNITTDGADHVNLGDGLDRATFIAPAGTQIRLTFTGTEVGNGDADDSGALLNQDGDLAVRVQLEDSAGNLIGPVSRYDDEGISFIRGAGQTFDVRDLVTGAARGDLFDVVRLGTSGDDTINDAGRAIRYYYNGGAGNDTMTAGTLNDVIVGGLGNDTIFAGLGDDSTIFNITTDGGDRVDLGEGLDRATFVAPAGTQIRVTLTADEVGNGDINDSGALLNQDGDLAVRVQLEDSAGNLTGPVSRYDDEGISFIRSVGQTFDVRDLVSGVSAGDVFDVIRLGTSGDDTISDAGRAIRYYYNGGEGNDTFTGGTLFDFIVGGAGDDRIDGRESDDSLVGGAGADTFVLSGLTGNDRILDFVSGTDRIDFSAFAFTAANVTASAAGADTLLSVDADLNGAADFAITLIGVAPPVPGDFIF